MTFACQLGKIDPYLAGVSMCIKRQNKRSQFQSFKNQCYDPEFTICQECKQGKEVSAQYPDLVKIKHVGVKKRRGGGIRGASPYSSLFDGGENHARYLKTKSYKQKLKKKARGMKPSPQEGEKRA